MAKQYHWRKQKALAMIQNRRQWQRQFDPQVTAVFEILLENGNNLSDETRTDPNFNNTLTNIIAEHLHVTN